MNDFVTNIWHDPSIEGDVILKSEKAFVVPLSDKAIEVLRKQKGKLLNGYLLIKA